jgi:hypothetical protein
MGFGTTCGFLAELSCVELLPYHKGVGVELSTICSHKHGQFLNIGRIWQKLGAGKQKTAVPIQERPSSRKSSVPMAY